MIFLEKLHEFFKSCPDSQYGYSRCTLTASKKGKLKLDISFNPVGRAQGTGDTYKELLQNTLLNLLEFNSTINKDPYYSQFDLTPLKTCIELFRNELRNLP